ncbi:hypothetical protein [Candidatus Avelusimicrobium gallicola]|uniref:hypothetical protein n=1 Tax=Candidatus Avelusimicrobium gallicola TaxID=2562704 RepID=UPI001302A55A|nr:hypothetical protein [Elusimicrobium sp. An273]
MRLKRLSGKWLSKQEGQATVEYVLMLATIVVILAAFLTAFHTHIVRFFFTFIGQLLTS